MFAYVMALLTELFLRKMWAVTWNYGWIGCAIILDWKSEVWINTTEGSI